MKKARSSLNPRRKNSDVTQAIGGQPENDQDAREAGLSSATSANGEEKTQREGQGRAKPPAQTKERK